MYSIILQSRDLIEQILLSPEYHLSLKRNKLSLKLTY